MPISINNTMQNNEQYINEKELQEIIYNSPYIIKNENDYNFYAVKRELILRSAGILDILMVDAIGTPIAVEVKLSRNAQARREVVAQAFDYASDLSQITIDELNIEVNGAIEELFKIEELVGKGLWRTLAANLRAGILRIIIVIDYASEDLIRIVRYINDHSDLDIRLVEIQKYNNGTVVIPKILVVGKEAIINEPKISYSKSRNTIQKLVESFQKYNLPYIVRNGGKNYKTIDINNWPREIHYEFLISSDDNLTVDIHFEKAAYRTFASKLVDEINGKIEDFPLLLDQKWWKNCGRLFVEADINDINGTTEKMVKLISNTRDLIQKYINQ